MDIHRVRPAVRGPCGVGIHINGVASWPTCFIHLFGLFYYQYIVNVFCLYLFCISCLFSLFALYIVRSIHATFRLANTQIRNVGYSVKLASTENLL